MIVVERERDHLEDLGVGGGWYSSFKDEAQTALFKDPVRTAQ